MMIFNPEYYVVASISYNVTCLKLHITSSERHRDLFAACDKLVIKDSTYESCIL